MCAIILQILIRVSIWLETHQRLIKVILTFFNHMLTRFKGYKIVERLICQKLLGAGYRGLLGCLCLVR
jgi:hypothetical protein